MPSGIILSSGSTGATKEAVEKVLASHGLEVEKPVPTQDEQQDKTRKSGVEGAQGSSEGAVANEPKREDFDSDEEYTIAREEWDVEQRELEAAKEKDEVEEGEEEEETPPTPAQPAAKQSKFKKRIEKITAPLKRQIADLERRLNEKGGEKKTDEPPPVPALPPRPVRESFKTQEEYENALIAWGTEKTIRESAIKTAEQDQRKQLETNFSNYKKNVEEFRETVDDWDEVVNQDIPMHVPVQLAIFEQVNGAQVIYYLGKHPEYTRQLAAMSPLSAVMEVGRLSERLLAKSDKSGAGKGARSGGTASGSPGSGAGNREARTRTRAVIPAPIRPVSTAATSPSLTSRDAATNKDYKAFKRAQRAGR